MDSAKDGVSDSLWNSSRPHKSIWQSQDQNPDSGAVVLASLYCTASSRMPQKQNSVPCDSKGFSSFLFD